LGKATPENTQITISGSALVYAAGGDNSAGLGGGDGYDDVSGARITIGTGADYPVVIARGGTSSDYGVWGPAPVYACGIGSGGTSVASRVEITINSGFVAAQSGGTGSAPAWAIGTTADDGGSFVTINGGSVYTGNVYPGFAANLVSPAPKNAGGALVYPLYAASGMAGSREVIIPGTGGVFTGKTIGKRAAALLTEHDPGHALFPDTLGAVFWVPEGSYTGIIVNAASPYYADVTAGSLVPPDSADAAWVYR
jgi:hypothetical protein